MESKKRTLDSIARELQMFGFPYDVALSLWHRQHGREEESAEAMQAYLDELEAKQERMRVAELAERKRESSTETQTGYETKSDP